MPLKGPFCSREAESKGGSGHLRGDLVGSGVEREAAGGSVCPSLLSSYTTWQRPVNTASPARLAGWSLSPALT